MDSWTGLWTLCLSALLLLTASVAGVSSNATSFSGLHDGYNVTHYLVTTGKLNSAENTGDGRSLFKRPKRRAFSFNIFGIPSDTTLRFQLQLIKPFASEVTDFLGADTFNTEWYLNLRYKVSDLKATFFRKFTGRGLMNMTAAYSMMNATMQAMQNMTSASGYGADGYATGMSASSDQDMSSEDTAAAEDQSYDVNRVHELTNDYWARQKHGGYHGHGHRQNGYAGYGGYGQHAGYASQSGGRWEGYVNRRGELDNRKPEDGVYDGQAFRFEQKMKIYEKMKHMYSRQGQDGEQCVLRAICEVAEAPMEDGVLGDVVNILLSATNGIEDLLHTKALDKRYTKYLEAHMHGELNGNCQQTYHRCTLDLFDAENYVV